MVLRSPIQCLCETNWACCYKNVFESVLENMKKDSTMVQATLGIFWSFKEPHLVRVCSFFFFTILIGSVPSHYLTDTTSQFLTPASIHNKPTQAHSHSNLCTIWKTAKWTSSRRQAGSPALKMKGNLCATILSHLSTAARLQSRHAETTTALGRAAELRFCTVTVCGSCN